MLCCIIFLTRFKECQTIVFQLVWQLCALVGKSLFHDEWHRVWQIWIRSTHWIGLGLASSMEPLGHIQSRSDSLTAPPSRLLISEMQKAETHCSRELIDRSLSRGQHISEESSQFYKSANSAKASDVRIRARLHVCDKSGVTKATVAIMMF